MDFRMKMADAGRGGIEAMKEGTDFLLENACPSIKYRVRHEIWGEVFSSEEMISLQHQILQDGKVKEVSGWQQPDGWLAYDFHGGKSIETGIRVLCEKGVKRNNPVLKKALGALEKYTDRLKRGIGRVGPILDEAGLGGSLMMRAAIFSYAGIEDKSFLKEQVAKALEGFESVSEIDALDDIAEKYKGKHVFKSGVKWPSIYHLRLLAFTKEWRTPKNRRIVCGAIEKMIDLSPMPDVYFRFKSQLLAPASYAMDDFYPDMESMNDLGWMRWFLRTELLSRLGIVRRIPELRRQIDGLHRMLEEEGGLFTKRLSPYYFKRWGAYSGLMLERDWKSPMRRICDLTFRSLLMMHHSGVSHSPK